MTITTDIRAAAGCESAWGRSGLASLMARTSGRPDVVVGLIDGPIAYDHPGLTGSRVHPLSEPASEVASNRMARRHGTFVAGMLFGVRGGAAPAICPGCTFVHSAVFGPVSEKTVGVSADSRLLANGIIRCVEAGAEIINMSVAAAPSSTTDPTLADALSYAMHRRVVVVAAAGNDGTIGSSTITRHPAVLAVVACDRSGRPLPSSNLAGSIARRGIAALGDRVTSLDADGDTTVWSGTSVAAPFVTGALALLRSLFPATPTVRLVATLHGKRGGGRRSITPEMLNTSAAVRRLNST